MDGHRDGHTKSVRQTKINTIYHSNLRYDTNEPINETDSQTQRTDCGCQGGGGWGEWGLEFGVSRYKPLYNINNEVLLYSI